MLCSLNWLAEYVKLTVEAQELADRLSMAGLESMVERRYPDRIEGVIAAKILAVEPHPKADRLTVCTLETGGGEVKAVCGAPNVRAGLISPLALPGARLAKGLKVSKSRIRGVESGGVICAEDELGLSEDHSGIMELDQETEVGSDLAQIVDFDDYLLEVDLTPNRGDCACLIGLARETAALLGQELRYPDFSFRGQGQPIEELTRVDVLDPDLCPRYAASLLSSLKVGPSPWRLREKLISSGFRPISNLVDVTNFVLLELNQPLHAFDFDRLAEGRIVVRQAKPGERFVTLDGQERRLAEGMLLICDGQEPVGLAGIMGGLNSEIEPATERVLIEAAYFDPTNNRQTATRLGLMTEATYRFQRGVDPVGLINA
ncbi:MAG: phenylalanine--tRNA ligase subunit beta, partial [Deltaproteobacteria bacterium]|nr:phenylalanine--tRNA ligase subunit beta [Deltaproteobacteria bacterium]